MSDMKYNAVVGSGIEIVTRVDIPEELIPADARVRSSTMGPLGQCSPVQQDRRRVCASPHNLHNQTITL
eukprot:scaffold23250_cov31-Tisochrysis_lutea.AAC.6